MPDRCADVPPRDTRQTVAHARDRRVRKQSHNLIPGVGDYKHRRNLAHRQVCQPQHQEKNVLDSGIVVGIPVPIRPGCEMGGGRRSCNARGCQPFPCRWPNKWQLAQKPWGPKRRLACVYDNNWRVCENQNEST